MKKLFDRFRHIFKTEVIAYLVLVGFVIFAFANQEAHYKATTQNLKNNTQYVLVKSCDRGNTLRRSIDSVVFSLEPPIKAQEKKHIITKAAATKEIAGINQVAEKFAPVDCASTSSLNQKKTHSATTTTKSN